MFRGVFCARMSWKTSALRSRWSELAVGSLVPASGARALPWGRGSCTAAAWPADRIARPLVAFFLIKSSVNFMAVAVIGHGMAVGLVGPDRSLC